MIDLLSVPVDLFEYYSVNTSSEKHNVIIIRKTEKRIRKLYLFIRICPNYLRKATEKTATKPEQEEY
ncbi:MAG TPA: hypothetical protein DE060_08290 [Lentisphaeria bacterium]|nr:hypothetical protein [Lentisphaeria bacterium]